MADPLATLGAVLQQYQPSFAKLLPSHLSAERMFRVAMACIRQTPKLQQCTPQSLVSAMMVASELGLEPGGARGLLYLVPYGNVATPIVGYRGLIQLARNSGDLSSVESRVVNERDKFEVEFGLSPRLVHKPNLTDPGKAVAAYAIATLQDGTKQVEVMTVEDIEKVRAKSRSGRSGPWEDSWGEMAKKTVTRRLLKYLPLSSERLGRAMELDGDTVDGSVVVRPEVAFDAPATAQKALDAAKEISDSEAAEILAAEAAAAKKGE
jgi:recombination protein RecT